MRGRRMLAFSQHQADLERLFQVLARKLFNPLEEAIAYPLLHEPVRGHQRECIALEPGPQGFDPRGELLGREFLFELSQTDAPEGGH